MLNPQYFNQIKKGSTVMYGKQDYRVQDDGRGYLHIIVFEDGNGLGLCDGGASEYKCSIKN